MAVTPEVCSSPSGTRRTLPDGLRDNLHILVQMVRLTPSREPRAFATIKEEGERGTRSLRGLREPHGATGSSDVLGNGVETGSRARETGGVGDAAVTGCHFAACMFLAVTEP